MTYRINTEKFDEARMSSLLTEDIDFVLLVDFSTRITIKTIVYAFTICIFPQEMSIADTIQPY